MALEFSFDLIILLVIGIGLFLAVIGIAVFKDPYMSILGVVIILAAIMVFYQGQPELIPVTGIAAYALLIAIGVGIALAVLGLAKFRNPFVSLLGVVILLAAIMVTYRLAVPS